MSNIIRWQSKLTLDLFPLLLAFRGRDNFYNVADCGGYPACIYQNKYGQTFACLAFNTRLVEQSLSADLTLAFNPSFCPREVNLLPEFYYTMGILALSY